MKRHKIQVFDMVKWPNYNISVIGRYILPITLTFLCSDKEVMEHEKNSDTVFVGFPNWWYVAPRIIDTFVESYDFSGKILVPFATSGRSGMGKTVDELKKQCHNTD